MGFIRSGACYIRVSTDDQTEFSPDAQLNALKAYAKKNDIVLTKEHIYIDEGISGKRADKRPAFMKMIATAKSTPKPFDVILVHKFDRFARSREDSVVYKSLLKKEANIRVVSITEALEDDKFAVILEAMLEAMAEYYSLNLAEEVKKGMTEKATRGGYQTTAPFGYRIVNKELEIVEEEASIIKFIFGKFSAKEMNMLQLARYINGLGVKTKRGSPFENRTIDYILNNPVYIGKVRWTPTEKARRNFNHPDSIVAYGTHEAIIDIDTWNKAHEAIKELKELYPKKMHSNSKITTWLNGLVRCPDCGCTLVKNGAVYLQCNGYLRGVCKTTSFIKISVLENAILEELKKTFKGEMEINTAPKNTDVTTSNEYDMLNYKLQRIGTKGLRIKAAYEDGIDTLDEYKENKQRISEERKYIIEQLRNIKNSPINGDPVDENTHRKIESVYQLLSDDNISLDIKYKTAHFLINNIIFNKKEKTLYLEYK